MSQENIQENRFCEQCGDEVSGELIPAAIFQGKIIEPAWMSYPRFCKKCDSFMGISPSMAGDSSTNHIDDLVEDIVEGRMPAEKFTFENYIPELENENAFSIVKNFNPDYDNLYLWGPCGVGKTHLACSIVRKCVENRKSVIFKKLPNLLRYLRVKDGDAQDFRIKELAKSDCLVIDELGTGKESEFTLQILQEILDKREFSYKSGMVITTNFSLEQFAKKIGEDAIPSRLSRFKIVEMKGADHRLKPKNRC